MISISGLILAAIALAVPFLSPTIRRNNKIKWAVIVALLSHQGVSILQISVGPLPTIDADPVAFNRYAMRTGSEYLANSSYPILLRKIYDSVGGSNLLGCEISQFFFALSLVVLVWLIYHFELESKAHIIILSYSLLPSCMLNSSATLREAGQMFGMLGLAYCFLRLRKHGWDQYVILFPLCAFVLIRLHQGFSPYIALVVPVVFVWIAVRQPTLVFVAAFACIVFAPLLGPKIANAVRTRSVSLRRILDGRGLEYIENYSKKVNASRTAFGVDLDLSSPTRAVETGLIRYLQYLFSPFPWDMRGVKDSFGVFEGMFRLTLCFYAFMALWRSSGSRRQEILCLIYMFLLMEAVWAAGTANWGTAFRHRLPAWGYLVICATYGWHLGEKNFSPSETSESKASPVRPRRGAKPNSIRARRREIARKHSEKLERGERARRLKKKS